MAGSVGVQRGYANWDFPYFRKLWNRVVGILLAASFLPLVVIGGSVYYYSSHVLEEKTLDALRENVQHHQAAIDRFLYERIMDLKLITYTVSRSSITDPEMMGTILWHLKNEASCFLDLGVIDEKGRHLAYAGPYALADKNYLNAPWFQAVMAGAVHISDVFTGFRQVPHFIIAVKVEDPDGIYILRATVEADYFNNLVSEFGRGRTGEVLLINRKGLYQTVSGKPDSLMKPSGISDPELFEGIRTEIHGDTLRLMTWQTQVPWLCVIQLDRGVIFKALSRVRNISLFVFFLGGVIILFAIFFTTNYLVTKLEDKRKNIRVLDQKLRRVSYMASSMELVCGFFHELRESLINMDVAAACIDDALEKENLNDIRYSTEQLRVETQRRRKTIDKFLKFISPHDPVISTVHVHDILDDLVDFLSSDLRYRNILIRREYSKPLPPVRCERSKLRQIFQNLVLNAVVAVEKDGQITLNTRPVDGGVAVTVSDTGPGIPEDLEERIFEPLFTTRKSGTGLGLPLCRTVLDQIGGTISVQSRPSEGASFTVTLPGQFAPIRSP